MLAFRSFGSRQSRINPTGFETGMLLLIQSVCPSTGLIIPKLHSLSSSSLSAAFFFLGTARVGCCTGWAPGLSWIIMVLAPCQLSYAFKLSLNSVNIYCFVRGKQCFFSFKITTPSNSTHVDTLTSLDFGRRVLTLLWTCGVPVKEGGVTSGKAM